jgi:DNA gyrase subunit A
MPAGADVDEEAEGETAAAAADEPETAEAPEATAEPGAEAEGEERTGSSHRYPTKGRGGMGVRDIKTTERNGPVVGIVEVHPGDELIMMTARGKIQRIAADEIGIKGRNTMGVRIMSLDEGDTLAAVVRVPREEVADAQIESPTEAVPDDLAGGSPEPSA